jgi:hypothetical protein
MRTDRQRHDESLRNFANEHKILLITTIGVYSIDYFIVNAVNDTR